LPGPLARAQRRICGGGISPQIEHRLFSHITLNWRGRPLTSHQVVVNTIAATRTSGGLRVEAALDPGAYPTGVAISKERLAALPLQRHAIHGTWNSGTTPCIPSPSLTRPRRHPTVNGAAPPSVASACSTAWPTPG
jgi:Rhodopirellula transposase DDE domain